MSPAPNGLPGITGSARRMAATLVDIVRARLELAATELAEERLRLARQALVASAVLFCLGTGLVLGVLALAWWAGPAQGPFVLAASALLLLIGAALGYAHSRRVASSRPPLLHETIEQLRADAGALAPEREAP